MKATSRMQRLGTRLLGGEIGQSAVLIALLSMFAFIALTALAIDGGTLYLARRGLHNKSDAACLAASVEIALGGDTAAAQTAAEDYIALNGGSSAWYTPQTGSGVALLRGIEVNGLEVRVALQQEVATFFTRFIGQPPTLVGARSRCNAEAGGGLLPIAIKRFGEDPAINGNLGGNCEDGAYDVCSNPWGPDGIMNDVDCTNNTPPPGFSCDTRYGLDLGNNGQGKKPPPQHNIVDYAKSASVGVPGGPDVLNAWPAVSPATNKPADPACLYLPPYNAPPYAPAGCVGSDALNLGEPPGRAMYIVGDGALPNVASGSDFRFFITLDVRCITCGANRWYNTQYGIEPTSSVNTLKNTSMAWICGGYLGELPVPGDQLGVLGGADANQAAGEMGDCYEPGDVVAVVVYDGTVYRDIDFDLSVTPTSQSVTESWVDDGDGIKEWDQDTFTVTGPGPNSCVGQNSGILFANCTRYAVKITPDGPFNSSGVQLTVYTSDPLYWSGPDTNNDGVSDTTPIVASWSGNGTCDIEKDGSEVDIDSQISVAVSGVTSVTKTFCVWQRGSVLTPGLHQPMARTIFIDAYDPSTQLHHLTTARITVGTPGTQDYALALGNDPFLIVKQPNAGTQQITWDVDYESLGASVPGQPTLVWCTSSVGDDPVLPCSGPVPDVDVDFQPQGQDYRLTIRVKPTTQIGRYFFKLYASGGPLDNTPQGHFAMGGFDVVAESAGASAGTMNSFVVTLGYAKIRILGMDANSVVGEIIDAEVGPDDIASSFVPRLIPWE